MPTTNRSSTCAPVAHYSSQGTFLCTTKALSLLTEVLQNDGTIAIQIQTFQMAWSLCPGKSHVHGKNFSLEKSRREFNLEFSWVYTNQGMKHVQVSNFFLPIPKHAKYLWEGRAWRLKSFKCLVLPICNWFFIWKCQTTHSQLIAGKATGTESEGNCFVFAARKKQSALLGKPGWKRAEITPVGSHLLQNLSQEAQVCGSACDTVLAISIQE